MNLAIDIGNSLTKMAVFEGDQTIDTFRTPTMDTTYLDKLFERYPKIDAAILVSTRNDQAEFEKHLERKVSRFIHFSPSIPIPIKNSYRTPETLGHDRIAGAIAAAAIYPNCDILIVDFGTAITIDFVNTKNEFLGGCISPGVTTRFKALNLFTGKLPLLEATGKPTQLLGNTTESALQNGVLNGIIYEIEGYINRLSSPYPNLRIIFTGGDCNFFVNQFKNPILASRDLVVYGLNRILEYNAQ